MLSPNGAEILGRLLALPKAELHVHLDGSLRPGTLVELAEAGNHPIPSHNPSDLQRLMRADEATDLTAYLARFTTTLAVMQSAEALRRITHELVVDHAQENVCYVEIRFCPLLHTGEGLALDEVVEATLGGLRSGEAETGIQGGLILCGLRSLAPATSLRVAEVAVRYRDRGVVAFDLAGAEAGYPASEHRAAFDRAVEAGLDITIHAGEGAGPDSIRDALVNGHARRIGHGTRLHEDPELEAWVRDRGITLEVCLTSNVQTRVTHMLRDHPVRRYFDLGIPVTLCTDNRLISGTTLTEEYLHANEELGFTWDDLVAVARTGFASAFLPADDRSELLARFDAEVSSPERPIPRRS